MYIIYNKRSISLYDIHNNQAVNVSRRLPGEEIKK